MENATKALLIAAAILITIVVISVGVYVLNSGTTMVKENSDMSDIEISTYNTKFEAYCGTRVSGTKVKELIKKVEQHNRSTEDDSKKITLTGVTSTSSVGTGNSYKVEVPDNGYTTAGLISTINITANSN